MSEPIIRLIGEEYDVMYRGMVIGQVKGESDEHALANANALYVGGNEPLSIEKVER